MEIIVVTSLLVLLDIATGLTAAAMNGTLSSKVARRGLIHKMAYVATIALAYILDYAQTFLELGLPFQLVTASCTYIILVETLSIIENIALINPELRGSGLLKLFIGSNPEEIVQEKSREKEEKTEEKGQN